jgi:lactoylglutathione lyase
MTRPRIYLSIIITLLISMNAYSQTRINHIAVYVKNLKESSHFYEKVVGLKEIDEPFKDGLHAWYDMGVGTSLHLIEREEPWSNPTINKTNHLCFSVADLDAFIARLAQNNVPFEDWPGKQGEINIRPDGIKQIYIRDPNGYWLEINDEF